MLWRSGCCSRNSRRETHAHVIHFPTQPAERFSQGELLDEVIAMLKEAGGSLPKADVEANHFEKLKTAFEHPYYQHEVGGGVPRWKKNLQFPVNAGRES